MNLELVLIVFLVGTIFYQYDKINKLVTSQTDDINSSQKIETEILQDNLQNKILEDEIKFRKDLKERDYNVVLDPLTPGERRLPSHQVPRGLFRKSTNIPTQGHPDNYQYLGNLVRDTDDKILPVFGRQTYPGSNYYEYYLMINQDGNFGLKLPLLDGKSTREIEDGDTVNVDYFKSTPGEFKFKQFDYDIPRYNPFDY